MITKIVLENFMAHEHTELELGPGVNALTGPNNTGKSAVVEALRCVATNPVPKHYIRHGAKEARVSLEFEDGVKVVWVRKKRSSGYEIWPPGAEEPEEYWKFGRKPPEDVLAALKLDLVELETGGEIDVHVGNQREPVFLLNQPGSNAAAFFAASTESAHLLAMQNLLKRRTQDSKRQEKGLKKRLEQIESEMDQFSPLPDIEVEVETARELEAAAKQLQSDIPALENVLSSQENLTKSLAQREATATILKEVVPTPKLRDISGLDRLISQLEEVETARKNADRAKAALTSLSSVPATHDTAALAMVCEQMQRLEKALWMGESRKAATVDLPEPPALQNTVQLSGIIDEMLASLYRSRREARRHTVLQTIAEPPLLTPNTPLEALLADIRGVEGMKQTAEASLTVLENRLQMFKDDIAHRVNELGCCPTCGADINTEAFLDRRCRHDG